MSLLPLLDSSKPVAVLVYLLFHIYSLTGDKLASNLLNNWRSIRRLIYRWIKRDNGHEEELNGHGNSKIATPGSKSRQSGQKNTQDKPSKIQPDQATPQITGYSTAHFLIQMQYVRYIYLTKTCKHFYHYILTKEKTMKHSRKDFLCIYS